jgi:branched-subunit amino acid ABC-type transport system permease component
MGDLIGKLFVAAVVGVLILIGRNVAKKCGWNQVLGAFIGFAIGGGPRFVGLLCL